MEFNVGQYIKMKNRVLKMEAPDGYRLCNITATTYELDLAVLRQLMAEYSEAKWKIFCDSTMINDTEKDTVDISEFESLVIPVKMSLAPFAINDSAAAASSVKSPQEPTN